MTGVGLTRPRPATAPAFRAWPTGSTRWADGSRYGARRAKGQRWRAGFQRGPYGRAPDRRPGSTGPEGRLARCMTGRGLSSQRRVHPAEDVHHGRWGAMSEPIVFISHHRIKPGKAEALKALTAE